MFVVNGYPACREAFLFVKLPGKYKIMFLPTGFKETDSIAADCLLIIVIDQPGGNIHR
jgi:hypothetical protein